MSVVLPIRPQTATADTCDIASIAATLGLPVFPCRADKKPATPNGFKDAVTDPDAIAALWRRYPGPLIGVPTGSPSGLVVADVDTKNGQNGMAWLEENREALPQTRTHRTQSGGLHLVFPAPEGVEIRNSASRVAPGVDVRGEGGYVIWPGSPGYTVVVSAEPAEMPLWLVRACRKEEATAAPPPHSSYNEGLSRYAATALVDEAQRVRSAANGTRNEQLNKSAFALGTLVGAGYLSRSLVEHELTQAALDAGLDPKEIAATIKSGLESGMAKPREAPEPKVNGHSYRMFEERPQSSSSEGEDTSEQMPNAAKASVNALVEEFNEQYLVVNEGGKAIIYSPTEDPILNRRYHERIGFDDLRRLYMNRAVQVGTDDKGRAIRKPVADVWLKHPDRRQFIRGVVCDPTGRKVAEGTLNLWQGFAVQPKPGSWQRMKDHILIVICRGNTEHYEYVINWMARLVQRPAQQGDVAIVMRGTEGTGKGTLARALKYLFGQHGLHISNSKHLTGNFNSHLRDCIFLFADEAFFAGDRAHVGVLKALITEPSLTIEGKYVNAVQSPNYLHIMMASNEEWVVPASLEARRFFVLEVSDCHRDDHAYFEALWQEMENGGYEAMLHELLERDITHFNHWRIPVGAGLQQQKKLSLGTNEAWWLDVLHRGYVFKSKLGLEDYFSEWFEAISTELLFASYTEFADKRRERHPLDRERFGTFMNDLGCQPIRPRNAATGEHVTDEKNMYGGTTRKAKPVIKARTYGYHLGSLPTARTAFAGKTGLTINWPSDQTEG